MFVKHPLHRLPAKTSRTHWNSAPPCHSQQPAKDSFSIRLINSSIVGSRRLFSGCRSLHRLTRSLLHTRQTCLFFPATLRHPVFSSLKRCPLRQCFLITTTLLSYHPFWLKSSRNAFFGKNVPQRTLGRRNADGTNSGQWGGVNGQNKAGDGHRPSGRAAQIGQGLALADRLMNVHGEQAVPKR